MLGSDCAPAVAAESVSADTDSGLGVLFKTQWTLKVTMCGAVRTWLPRHINLVLSVLFQAVCQDAPTLVCLFEPFFQRLVLPDGVEVTKER